MTQPSVYEYFQQLPSFWQGDKNVVNPDGTLRSKSGQTLSVLADAAAIWGQSIPISWGKRKLPAPMLQIGPVTVKFDWYQEWGGNVSGTEYAWGTDVVLGYACDYVVALGYAGDKDKVKSVRRIWINGVLKYDSAVNSVGNLIFTLYQGNETQDPDPRLKAAFGDQLAYRGLMYLIIQDMPAKWGSNGIPKVEVELWDNVGNATPVTDYTPLDGIDEPINGNKTSYDFKKRVFYSLTNGPDIRQFDSTSGVELARYHVTNLDSVPHWTEGGIGINNQGIIYADCDNSTQKYILTQGVGSNCGPMILLDADTGEVLDHYGSGNGNFENDIFNKTDASINQQFGWLGAFNVKNGQNITAYAITYGIDFFGGDHNLWKLGDFQTGTNLKLLDRQTVPYFPTGITPNATDVNGNTDVYLQFPDRIGRYRITGTGAVTYSDNIYSDPTLGNIRAVFSCPSDDTIIVFSNVDGGVKVQKIKVADGTVMATIAGPLGYPSEDFVWKRDSKTYGLRIGWVGGTTAYQINFLSLQLQSVPYTGPSLGYQPLYDGLTGTFVYATGGGSVPVQNIDIFNPTSNRIALSSFLTQLCVISGAYTADQVETSGIGDYIDGAIIDQKFTLRDMLTDLSKVYGFDIVESGDHIKFVRRPRDGSFTVDFTVNTSELALLSEDSTDDPVAVKTTRTQDSVIPYKVELKYIDIDYDYGVNTYSYQRPLNTTESSQTASYGIPIVMTQLEAAALVSRMNYDGWESRLEHEIRLGQKHLLKEPGDVIRIEGENFTDIAKITDATYNADFSVSIKAKNILPVSGPVINPEDYNPLVVVPRVVSNPGQSEVVVVDTPLIDYHDDYTAELEQYIATVPLRAGTFSGASVYRSSDGISYDNPVTAFGTPTVGRLKTRLEYDPNPISIHRVYSIDVAVISGSATDFVACTEAQMLAGANRMVIGAPGRWEIFAFSTVEVINGIVRLGGYIRGLRGTDHLTGTHTLSDLVLLVNDATLNQDRVPIELLDSYVWYKAVGLNSPVRGALATKVQFKGNSMKPFAPANIHSVKDAITDDITISWVRRTWGDPTPDSGMLVGFAEGETDTFVVKIYDGADLVRTENVTGTEFIYTSAMQSTDGFSLPIVSLRVTVVQVSTIVGNGFERDVISYVE